MNGQADVEVDYKRKYKNLKRKLKFLVYVSMIILSVNTQFWAIVFQYFYKCMYVSLCAFSPFQEQECFQEELRRAQRKLLKVSRDKRWDYIVCEHGNVDFTQYYVQAVA